MATDEDDGAEKRSRGRPTLYCPEYADQARKLCELGATDYELADFFEVDHVTIWRWQTRHEDFCNAVHAGKENLDKRVKRSLYQRAVGYTFETEKVFQFQGQIVRADTVEHVPPDPGAAMNWLKNRQPEEWREKIINEHGGVGGGPIQFTDEARVKALTAFLAKTAGKD